VSEETTDNPLAGLMAFMQANPDASAVPEPVVGEDETAREVRPQPVSKRRHWRQRFAGFDAQYIYRKAITITDVHGRRRRVRAGDPVDTEKDIKNLRRLKALWYAEMIELASPERDSAPRVVTTRNNRAIRERQERAEKRDAERQLQKRNAVRRARERQKEEDRQRVLAEQAVLAAEQREAAELAKLEAEERRAEEKAAAEEALLELQAREREEAAEAAAKAAEEAAEQAEREAAAAVERAEADAKSQAEYAEHVAAKQKRAEERAEAEAATRRTEEEKQALREAKLTEQGVKNPNTRQVDAKEARKAVLDRDEAPNTVPSALDEE